jgi:DNA-binding LacI/PurR family transcriptional regulator
MLNAEQFHELRMAAGMSIYTLANRAGVHWLTVLNAENPERTIRPETRQRLEGALRAAIEEQAVLVATARWLLGATEAA